MRLRRQYLADGVRDQVIRVGLVVLEDDEHRRLIDIVDHGVVARSEAGAKLWFDKTDRTLPEGTREHAAAEDAPDSGQRVGWGVRVSGGIAKVNSKVASIAVQGGCTGFHRLV